MRKRIQGDWTFKWYQHKEMIMDNNSSNIELGDNGHLFIQIRDPSRCWRNCGLQ